MSAEKIIIIKASNSLADCARLAETDTGRDTRTVDNRALWLVLLHGLTLIVAGIRTELKVKAHCQQCGKVL